jgi:hypothetical protein
MPCHANQTLILYIVNKSKDPITTNSGTWFCLTGQPYPPSTIGPGSTQTVKLIYSSYDSNCAQGINASNEGTFDFTYNYTNDIWCNIQGNTTATNWNAPRVKTSDAICNVIPNSDGTYEIDISHPIDIHGNP